MKIPEILRPREKSKVIAYKGKVMIRIKKF